METWYSTTLCELYFWKFQAVDNLRLKVDTFVNGLCCRVSARKLFSKRSKMVPHVGALLISVKRHSFRRLMTLFDFLNYVGLAVAWVKSIQRAEYM